MSECGKILKIQYCLGDLCSLEPYEIIYIYIEILKIGSFFNILLYSWPHPGNSVSLVTGLHMSNICIFM